MSPLLGALPSLSILSAVLCLLFAARLRERVASLSIGFSLVTFLVALALLVHALMDGDTITFALNDHWGMLRADPLGALMGLVIAGISLVVHIYSRRYMADEPGYARFFALLDLMAACLLLMVAAGDLITLLVAWHLVGILLYFLLAQDTRNPTADRYAQWTLLTYRFGDLPLLFAAGLLYNAYGTWSLPELFAAIQAEPAAHQFLGLPLVEVAGWLIALAAFARSAQFLLHIWLPYTMSGPTPVSALMHAGIVNAGGFLLNRFAPLFMHTSEVLHWVFLVGLVTAIVGSVLMLAQNDVKKALGYSTMGQMGFMIMECGVGAFSLAIFHLIAHGLFKGTLFLGAGGVIGDARKDDGTPKEEIYTFMVERRAARQRQPWLVMAALTVTVPLLILFLAHWMVAQDFFYHQGPVVLLFFGWVTGAQLIFASYRMHTENPWRLFGLILVSFTIVVVGYVLISHAFDLFLYPDEALRAGIQAAAGIDLVWFDALVVVMTLVIIIGWIRVYRAERNPDRNREPSVLWANFYALLAREFHMIELFTGLSRSLLGLADRLNRWLRWA